MKSGNYGISMKQKPESLAVATHRGGIKDAPFDGI